MPDDEDFSEIDTTAAEFDAMWAEAEAVEIETPLAANLTVNFDGRVLMSELRGATAGTRVKAQHTPHGTILEGDVSCDDVLLGFRSHASQAWASMPPASRPSHAVLMSWMEDGGSKSGGSDRQHRSRDSAAMIISRRGSARLGRRLL
jgi:hypothetical protein